MSHPSHERHELLVLRFVHLVDLCNVRVRQLLHLHMPGGGQEGVRRGSEGGQEGIYRSSLDA
eukprot:3051623-Pyramimonas_sp.AAC.1